MDAVMFDVKGAHLALQRVGRSYAHPHGMTVARFDLMNALGSKGMLQKNLWKLLGVTRSVVCEMLRGLLDLEWVKRVKAADSRTWLIMLTVKGKEKFDEVFYAHVESGEVATTMERGLSHNGAVDATLPIRERLLWDCAGITEAYRTRPTLGGVSLYMHSPEDYYADLTTPEEGTWGTVPMITDVDWEAWGPVEIDLAKHPDLERMMREARAAMKRFNASDDDCSELACGAD